MIWRVDPTSDQPLYAQLVAQVFAALARGELAPGERLPAARDLADSLDLNMHTVLRAYGQLRDDGVIELRRGRGAIIVGNPGQLDEVYSALTAFVAAVHDAGLSPEAATTLVKEVMSRCLPPRPTPVPLRLGSS